MSKIETYIIDGLTYIANVVEPSKPLKLKWISLSKNESVGRNRPCLCNSGKKYKLCCLKEITNDKEI